MNGRFEIALSTKRLCYEITVERKISVIVGNSGTGKTILIDLIDRYLRDIELAGTSDITLKINDKNATDNDIEVAPLRRFYDFIKDMSGKIIFIDEDSAYINNPRFAGLVKNRDNYYIIIARDKIINLPFSAKALFKFIVDDNSTNIVKNIATPYYKDSIENFTPNRIITEDVGMTYFFKREEE